jgi:hypothetical protein
MNNRANNERLLSEILAEDTPAGFREDLLAHTLRLARRRRLTRQARLALVPLALVMGLSFLAWHKLTPNGRFPEPARAYVLVHTRPLPPQAYVQTQRLAAAELVGSRPAADILTTAGSGYRAREIDDEELLALAAPNSVVLVRYSPHRAELLFAGSPRGR